MGQYPHAAVQGGGPIYTPSGGVVSMRVVNNSVMTPAVMTTMPSSVPSNPQSNPPIQIQHQMRPPPGLQAVTVQPNEPVQVQLSPSQRYLYRSIIFHYCGTFWAKLLASYDFNSIFFGLIPQFIKRLV